ncbi:MAG: PEP-CTERM sorting domain-containing protein [Phycisphaerae bacterium]|nr:PEP-CTERM sorting domain-containing protein [Phycisphaerae bacterium]
MKKNMSLRNLSWVAALALVCATAVAGADTMPEIELTFRSHACSDVQATATYLTSYGGVGTFDGSGYSATPEERFPYLSGAIYSTEFGWPPFVNPPDPCPAVGVDLPQTQATMTGYNQGAEIACASGHTSVGLEVAHDPHDLHYASVPPNMLRFHSSVFAIMTVEDATSQANGTYGSAHGEVEIHGLETTSDASLYVESNEDFPAGSSVWLHLQGELTLTGENEHLYDECYSMQFELKIGSWQDTYNEPCVIDEYIEVISGQTLDFHYKHTAGLDLSIDDGPPYDSLITLMTMDLTAVPEPATISLLTLGGLALLHRRRRA